MIAIQRPFLTGIFPGYPGGIKTESMISTTPLSVLISVIMIFAL